MSHSETDRNLLVGILALQMDFINRDQLIEAMNSWVLDKSKTLEDVLLAADALEQDTHTLLVALVAKHLQLHGGDAEKSLASVSSIGSVRDALQSIGDPQVDGTLASIPAAHAQPDPYATQATVGHLSSKGQRFKILRPHATGGLGTVLVARDTELQREVALKEIQQQFANDTTSRERFLIEAEVTGGLEHPGIVPVYGLGQYADGRPFYAMRLIRGDSLKQAIDRYHKVRANDSDPREESLELRKLLGRFIDVCNAIAYAHSRGILHRDLKPGNVMLGKYGETLVVDWGLAKVLGRSESNHGDEATFNPCSGTGSAPTQLGQALGTPAFMSPEQAEGRLNDLGATTDVYSLGATLYCLLTGQAPFKDSDVAQLLSKVRTGNFPRASAVNPSVPKPLEAICHKSMELNAHERYPTPKALAEDVENWLADEPVSAYAEPFTQRASRWMRRHRSWTRASAAAILLVSAVSAVAILSISRARRDEAKAWELTAKTREFDLHLLEQSNLDATELVKLESLLNDISQLSVPDAEVRRIRMYEACAECLQDRLHASRFSDEDRAQFDRHLALLKSLGGDDSKHLDKLVSDLVSERDARLRNWDTVFELTAPFDDRFSNVFSPRGIQIEDGQSLCRIAGEGTRYARIPTRVACPAGNIELRTSFDRSWLQASLIGLSLSVNGDHRYDFLLAVPRFDYRDTDETELDALPRIGDVVGKRVENYLDMYIMRDGLPLRKSSIRVEPGRLRIIARREGGTLTLTINDRHTAQFEDPFPLPTSQHDTFGVYWPQSVHLDRLHALRLRTPAQPSPIELGDELFARGEFSESLDAFRTIDSLEAQYKTALCHFRLGNDEESLRVIEQIAAQPPGGDDADDRWRLRAACRMLQHRVESRDWQRVRELLRDLSALYDREQIALLIPATERELLLQYFRRPGLNRSSFFGELKLAVEDIEWALLVEEMFGENPSSRRMTKWRLADAHRWNKQIGKATAIIRELIDGDESSVSERIALVSDLADVLAQQGDTERAGQEVNRWLLDSSGAVQREYLPLLVIRAANHMVAGNEAAAQTDLDNFFDTVSVEEIDHSHFVLACGLRGMLYEDEGNEEAAQEIWRKGLRRHWHEGYLEPNEVAKLRGVEAAFAYNSVILDGILGSWTGEMTPSEAYRMMWNQYPGSGVFSTSFRNLVKAAFKPEFARDVHFNAGQTARGRKEQRRSFLQHSTPGDAYIYTVAMVKLSCLQGIEISPELDRSIEDNIRRMLGLFADGHYRESELRDVLNVWRCRFSRAAFLRMMHVTEPLDAELAASAAVALGNKYLQEGEQEIAKFLLEYGLASGQIQPAMEDLARRQLALLSGDFAVTTDAS